MAEDSPRPSTSERDRTMGSLARAFDKVRAAVKRRSSTIRHPNSPAPGATPVEKTAVPETTNDHAILSPAAPGAAELTPGTSAIDGRIEVDESEGDDLDELLPLPAPSGRRSLTTEKARELFVQHGFQYDSRARPMQEPPAKIRRVEKAIRLRVHWTCHQCSTQFGMERICVECGHHRCLDCSRHPPKKVRDLVDSTRMAFEHESRQREGSTTPERGTDVEIHAGPAPREEPSRPPARSPLHLIDPLELDDGDEADADADVRDFDFIMYARPRAGIQTVTKPKAHLVRRICHRCESSIHRNECQNCGHLKCNQCPRIPEKPKKQGKSAEGEDHSDEEVPMVRAVQRVYRKPRQRVRYTCEHCESVFVERSACQGCGHERCTNCHREPPKRAPIRHDPAVLQAVADRLAAYGATPQHSPGVTVGGA